MQQYRRQITTRLNLRQQAIILAGIVACLWLVEIIDVALWRVDLDAFGIRPRTWAGILHIPIAPLLHVNFAHLVANSVPLFLLGWLIILRGVRDFAIVVVVATLISGLGIWLFGASNSVHIGASGVVFGFLGYLLARGYWERSLVAIALGVAALLFYGGMLWGVLPGQPAVSWQGHLFGFLGGVLAAYVLVRARG